MKLVFFLKILSIITVILSITPIYAEAHIEWLKTYGGPDDESTFTGMQTVDDGYILSGTTMEWGYEDSVIKLIKTNAIGDEEWSKEYGNPERDETSRFVQQTPDGGYIIAGVKYDVWHTDARAYLIKTDSDGNELWSKTYGYGSWLWETESVQNTIDGGYIIAGSIYETGYNTFPFLIKTDSDGLEEWKKTYSYYGSLNSAQQTFDGGYIMLLTTITDVGESLIRLLKTDSEGELIWIKELFEGDLPFTEPYTWGFSCKQTSDGGYIIGGSINFHYGGKHDFYLLKTDVNGDMEWSNNYGDHESEEKVCSVQQTTDGGYIIAGICSTDAEYDIYLVKTDSNGYMLWTKTIDCYFWDYVSHVQQTSDEGYAVIGYTNHFGIDSDAFIIKIEPRVVKAECIIQYNDSKDDYDQFVLQAEHEGMIATSSIELDSGNDSISLMRQCRKLDLECINLGNLAARVILFCKRMIKSMLY
jgi:hypothetical protein